MTEMPPTVKIRTVLLLTPLADTPPCLIPLRPMLVVKIPCLGLPLTQAGDISPSNAREQIFSKQRKSNSHNYTAKTDLRRT